MQTEPFVSCALEAHTPCYGYWILNPDASADSSTNGPIPRLFDVVRGADGVGIPDCSSGNRGTGSGLLPHWRAGGFAPLDRAAATVRCRSAAPLESTLRGGHHPPEPDSLPAETGLLSRGSKAGTGSSFSFGEGPHTGTNRQTWRSSQGCWISSSVKERKNSPPIPSNECCSSTTCGPCSIF